MNTPLSPTQEAWLLQILTLSGWTANSLLECTNVTEKVKSAWKLVPALPAVSLGKLRQAPLR